MNKKPGRNDPCPCGSGKKYKQCHGAVGAEEEEKKKLYTPTGKRKFKAVVLSAGGGKSQGIFGQSASTQKMPEEVGGAPGSLLKFRKATRDYRVEEGSDSSYVIPGELKEPTMTSKEEVDKEKPFEMTQEDFRQKEKEK